METEFFVKLQKLCLSRGISVTKLVTSLGKSASAAAGWRRGKYPRAGTLKHIADYFDVPVEYFTESYNNTVRADNIQTNHGFIGHANAPVIFKNGERIESSDQMNELIRIYKN